MTNDIQIVFHSIDQTDALTEAVTKRIEKAFALLRPNY